MGRKKMHKRCLVKTTQRELACLLIYYNIDQYIEYNVSS